MPIVQYQLQITMRLIWSLLQKHAELIVDMSNMVEEVSDKVYKL